MKVEIRVPEHFMPKIIDPDNVCECQKRPFQMAHRHGTLHWSSENGARVCEGEVVAEGEVEKKTIEFPAPCAGILEIVIEEDGRFGKGDVIGFIKAAEV